MAKIRLQGKMIVLSCHMRMEKSTFEKGANDQLFADVCNMFLQNGWSPISELSHMTDGEDKVRIVLEFTVPQNETTMSTTWLEDTGKLMHLLLHTLCTIIDSNDTFKQCSDEFHRVATENGILLLPAPKKERPKPYTIIVYDTGNNIEAFNNLIPGADCGVRTKWPQGFKFVRTMTKEEKETLHKQLCDICCEHTIQ